MKLGITFVALGTLGVGQYFYFLLTPGYWTDGIIGAVIGIVLLTIGIFRLIKAKHETKVT